MNTYNNSHRAKYILAIFAIVMIIASLVYTNFLARKLQKEEYKKMKLYAEALEKINDADTDDDLTFYFDVINEETIPLISVDDSGVISDYKNFIEFKTKQEDYLPKQLEKMKMQHEPITIELPGGSKQFLYYKDSKILVLLKWFPYIQLFVTTLFLYTAYFLFSQARKAEQNRVWVGMSKETAHQLGTPITALMGWIEYLKISHDEEVKSFVPEMEKDLKRLELIADRFSKIGSSPKLSSHDVVSIVRDSIEYMKLRSPKRVEYKTQLPHESIHVMLYPPLFNWVVENILKNALDALDGKGCIEVDLRQLEDEIIIDIKDNGKGIAVRNKNIVFKPGYSTKKRGWGLGLSLAKRIIEEYHYGRIFVLDSEKEKGTTFRIILNHA